MSDDTKYLLLREDASASTWLDLATGGEVDLPLGIDPNTSALSSPLPWLQPGDGTLASAVDEHLKRFNWVVEWEGRLRARVGLSLSFNCVLTVQVDEEERVVRAFLFLPVPITPRNARAVYEASSGLVRHFSGLILSPDTATQTVLGGQVIYLRGNPFTFDLFFGLVDSVLDPIDSICAALTDVAKGRITPAGAVLAAERFAAAEREARKKLSA